MNILLFTIMQLLNITGVKYSFHSLISFQQFRSKFKYISKFFPSFFIEKVLVNIFLSTHLTIIITFKQSYSNMYQLLIKKSEKT